MPFVLVFSSPFYTLLALTRLHRLISHRKLVLVLRSSLALSFPPGKSLGRIYLLWPQTLIRSFIRANEERSASEVMYGKEPPNLSESICHSRAPTQPGCRRLECPRDAWSTWSVDLSWVCSDRHGQPVLVPAVPGSLPLLVPSRMRGHREQAHKRR